jgi:hypothetical protein
MAIATPPSRKNHVLPEPVAGVIEEARRRRRARLLSLFAASAAVLAVLVGLAAAGIGGGAAKPRPLRLPPEPPRISPARLAAAAPDGVAVRVVPSLEGAQAGWTVQIIDRTGLSGTEGRLPSPENAIVTAMSGWSAGEPRDTSIAVTGPDVASVRFSDGRTVQRTVRTTAEPGLPFGMRVALLRTSHRELSVARSRRVAPIRVTGVWSATGELLHSAPEVGSGLPWRIWNPPAKPSPGACALHVSGGYAPKWGQVAAAIRPYPAPIYGRAFVSCIDTEYFPPGCHSPGCGIRASVLLDAASPGHVAPASIPGLSPIKGLAGYANSAQDYGFDQLSARRVGQTWIVAEDGGEHAEAARIQLLRDLSVTMRRG